MLIGGLEKLSLIDFPGKIAAVVFTKSCNFRCHFCYNPMLVLDDKEEDSSLISEEDLLLFFKSRIGKLEAIVISGGEPTLHSDLKEFIMKIKKFGFKVKLDTNGTRPEVIKELIDERLIDYIAMDIKAPLDKYEQVVAVKVDKKKIKRSIDLIMENKIDYEFRTTIVPGLHDKEDILQMAKEIAGAKKWFLQKFKLDTDLINNDFKNVIIFSEQETSKMLKIAQKYVNNCKIRV